VTALATGTRIQGYLCAWYRGVYQALLNAILGEDARGSRRQIG
jgi:hypothetical protein